MKAILITACPSGVATTFLAARRLEQAARRRGWQVTVEMHGELAPPQPASEAEVRDADLVIVAADHVPEAARFTDKRLFQAPIAEALPDPEAFLSRAEREAAPYRGDTASVATSAAPEADKGQRIVAVTACPTGVAHTFMAAEALEEAGRGLGHHIRVETQGSVGAQNQLSEAEIADADVVLLACDIEVDDERFAGKRIYRTSTGNALKKAKPTIQEALANAAVESQTTGAANDGGKAKSVKEKGVYKHLLTGVSFMLPMVVAGGLCIALSFVFGIEAFKEEGTLASALMQIGGDAAFALMVPVLAGYIAYSIADRPGIAPGMIGGMLASNIGAGFIGGILAGFLAGYAAKAITRYLKLPASVESLKPILIIPLLASLFTGLVMIYVIGTPVAGLLDALTHFLNGMGSTNAVLLGMLLGGMMCVDMGGPVNKAAYTFGVGLLSSETYAPMAAIMAAGMVPPLAMGIASILAKRKFDETEREGGKAAFVLGLCFITEGAIPFAAKDPLRVLPVCIIGGAITGALSMYFGIQLMAPHGGLFVLLIPNAVNYALLYLLAIAVGAVIAGVAYAVIKPRASSVPIAEGATV
ncbi:PTS system D-fructose-specific IIB component (F1P-forming) (Frc family) /PTS system D-fructose-specific IIC component (F1P-forming) (Frc family) [Chromohalobacter marismortui]|uniref:protein-N(pi)-phosphohistidine--D-fructose phosphotransferase n=1 Tax=Chromohalobacter marismortui TaxID=42055 RepID=A0A4R7NLS2_9GAMM|nr:MULTISPECIES: PTS fructose transporter subunit IIBC [Chromohalobacter]MCI0510132.1 PTS fructose transporter subunit IIBC [Chromohalobacter sp.]MCI0594843.1 PTS fructose transporter subunit IIBC [Chromohalobacter sp.]TDU21548.1 PTS system D-fructose-specific IIB component (F1P-forming) (Frc family) /PTS system D-fructose-specific IIC component (F1P-forming) (Frc family) [Chromohalobacter marismortui]